jgi:hypothetical protein
VSNLTFINAWTKARTGAAIRAILADPELAALEGRWPDFWAAYAPAARPSRRSPAARFVAEQSEAADAALAAAVATSHSVRAAVARTHTRNYWLDVYGGVERTVVARRQARFVLTFAARGWAADPRWRTSTVAAIAAGVVGTGDLAAVPILADALQDAGCDDEDWLAAMRDPDWPWCRGSPVLRSLLSDRTTAPKTRSPRAGTSD